MNFVPTSKPIRQYITLNPSVQKETGTMTGRIFIAEAGEIAQNLNSAERISRLLETTFCDSEWIHQCDGTVCVTHFLSHSEQVVIKGLFFGCVNGREFAIPFERDYLIGDNVSASAWLKSPIFALLMSAFRAFYNEQDPTKKAQDWITRSEFEIASKLEAEVNKIVGAPVEGIHAFWRNALVVGGTVFLLVSASTTIYCFFHPHSRNLKDGPFSRFIVSLMAGIVFAGLPAGLSGLLLCFTFVGREIEDSVAGQSLLRLVGAKNAQGLRMICILGAILCLGVTASFVLLITRN